MNFINPVQSCTVCTKLIFFGNEILLIDVGWGISEVTEDRKIDGEKDGCMETEISLSRYLVVQCMPFITGWLLAGKQRCY